MKRIFMTIVAATLVMAAMAQRQNRPEHRPMNPKEMVEHQTNRMAEQLGLTAEQKAKVFDLNVEFNKNMPKRNRGERPTEGEISQQRQNMEKALADYEAGLKKVLTEEQFNKYAEMRKQQRQQMQRNGNGNGRRNGAFEGPRNRRGAGFDAPRGDNQPKMAAPAKGGCQCGGKECDSKENCK